MIGLAGAFTLGEQFICHMVVPEMNERSFLFYNFSPICQEAGIVLSIGWLRLYIDPYGCKITMILKPGRIIAKLDWSLNTLLSLVRIQPGPLCTFLGFRNYLFRGLAIYSNNNKLTIERVMFIMDEIYVYNLFYKASTI